jgi:hypothetical protein
MLRRLNRAKDWLQTHEASLFFIVSLLFLVVVIAGSARSGAVGQDFPYHLQWVQAAANDPWQWVVGQYFRTSPPLYHLLVAPIHRMFGSPNWLLAVGVFNGVVNYLSLWLLFCIARLTISDILLRLSLYTFVAFLPAYIITGTVLAADALATLPALAAGLCLTMLARGQIRTPVGLLWLAMIGIFAVSIKYVSFGLIIAIMSGIVLLAKVKAFRLRPSLVIAMTFGALTFSLGIFWINQRSTSITNQFDPTVAGHVQRGKMNLRSLLCFRRGDLRLLNAPPVWDLCKVESPHSLYQANYFSYPGLLCYGTFTDSMNIFQPKPFGTQWGTRSTLSRFFSKWSLRLGTISFIVGCCLTIAAPFVYLRRLYRNTSLTDYTAIIFWLIGAGTFAFIMAILPLVAMSYVHAYWMPRLVVPGIVCLAVTGFCLLDQFSGFLKQVTGWPILGFTLVQALFGCLALVGI